MTTEEGMNGPNGCRASNLEETDCVQVEDDSGLKLVLRGSFEVRER